MPSPKEIVIMETKASTTLPPSVIAALYRNVLIAPNEPAVTLDNKEEPPLSATKLLSVVLTKDPVLSAERLQFLSSIMNACKLMAGEYQVLPVQDHDTTSYLNLKARFEAPIVLLFGITPAALELPIHFPHFQLQSFQGTQYLAIPPLEAIEMDKSLKMQLWQCLKPLFT